MLTIVVNSPLFSRPYFAVVLDGSIDDIVAHFRTKYPSCTFAFEEVPSISQPNGDIILLGSPILKSDNLVTDCNSCVCDE